MKVLDVFCGLGGWSEGFHAEGFDCVGIDIVDVGYPYSLILRDIRTIDPSEVGVFDVIVGSPPCRDFSQTASFGWKYWRDKPNVQRGLELVHQYLKLVENLDPPFWLMENVPRLSKYLNMKPRATIRLKPTMRRSLWGTYPDFLIPLTIGGRLKQDIHGKYRSWQRAKIPFAVSQSLAVAVKQALKVEA